MHPRLSKSGHMNTLTVFRTYLRSVHYAVLAPCYVVPALRVTCTLVVHSKDTIKIQANFTDRGEEAGTNFFVGGDCPY